MVSEAHKEQLAKIAQAHAHPIARRRQLVRFFVILLIILTWAAVNEPAILTDIEKFIALIGVTGAGVLILKLWPDNGQDH